MNNWLVAAIMGIGIVNGTGNGSVFKEMFTYLGQHAAPLGQIAMGFSVVAFFVAWVALEGDRIRSEDEVILKEER